MRHWIGKSQSTLFRNNFHEVDLLYIDWVLETALSWCLFEGQLEDENFCKKNMFMYINKFSSISLFQYIFTLNKRVIEERRSDTFGGHCLVV